MIGNVTKGQVFSYFMMPSVLPRIHTLLFTGFGYVALFMAQIFKAAGLLPPGHPYLNAANVERFGVRHVLAEAFHHLSFKKENLDQILIFVILLTGFVLLMAQIAFLLLGLVMGAAHAAMPTSFVDLFVTQAPEQDIAFILLDRVFGVQGVFTGPLSEYSCVMDLGINCTFDVVQQADSVMPFHIALHQMFGIYSTGLMVIGLLIFLYFVFAVLAETMQTGTPLGKRFNHVWAPIRMVVALGLLVPMPIGLNSAQYIVLYAAKWGSGFATNGWNTFVDNGTVSGGTQMGNPASMVATPNPPEINTLFSYVLAMHTCRYLEYLMPNTATSSSSTPPVVNAWVLKGSAMTSMPLELVSASSTYGAALQFSDYSDILIRFGERNETSYSELNGSVKSLCGDILIHTHKIDDPTYMGGSATVDVTSFCDSSESGAACIHRALYQMVQVMWNDERFRGWGCALALKLGEHEFTTSDPARISQICSGAGGSSLPAALQVSGANIPTRAALDTYANKWYADILAMIVDRASIHAASDPEWTANLKQHGWAGAGIWYNKIAQINGAIIGAAYSLPIVKAYPDVMEQTLKARERQDSDLKIGEHFCLHASDEKKIELDDPRDKSKARALCETYKIMETLNEKPTGNLFVDAVRALFGLDGLYNMFDNTDIHPLAQLVAIGKSLVDSAVVNIAVSVGAHVGGGIASLANWSSVGTIASSIGSFVGTIAFIGLGIGFVLFYVVPFLPFIYFFFAVGNWVKGIFEAMVGVPLWALAHIRIDGEGLPGEAAMHGYFLILEIFLRPILIIFGLLAGMLIFSAQVHVLHEIWDLAISNVGGFDMNSLQPSGAGAVESFRGVVDQFFYTVLYAIVVYMLANASFKLVDLIPNQLLRWMGASVTSFSEQAAEDVNMIGSTFMGGQQVMGQLRSGVGGLSQGVKADLAKGAKE